METILNLIEKKLLLCNDLIDKLQRDFSEIDGAQRTRRNIEKERKFLKKLKENCTDENVKLKLQCTNVNFFSHLVNCLDKYKEFNIISIGKNQRINGRDKTIKVDIVCDNVNLYWIRIIARNSDGIADSLLGRCEYGTKDILVFADEFQNFATLSEANLFRKPIVVFDFLHYIDEELEATLEEKGIVLGRKIRYLDNNSRNQQLFTKLNMDVSTMVAYVSHLSNGGAYSVYTEKLLNAQAAEEQKEAVKPFIEKVLDGKQLIACESTIQLFTNLIKILAGPNEKMRANELLSRIEVLPDVDCPEKILNIELSAQIKEQSRKTFAFGVSQKAVTVTSNRGFERAAKEKNFHIPMITHSARALGEMKQVQMKIE